jgi:diguanylate cyclase (GGDEF)-like protein
MDEKWPFVILYLRGIKDIKFLGEIQKKQLQELLLSIVRIKDYSQLRYNDVQQSILSIITRPYQAKLSDILRETSALAKEMHKLVGTHHQSVASIMEDIDVELSKGDNPALILAGIRDALKDVAIKMEQDVSSLTTLSYKDSLTGLANRRAFDKFLDECVERWQKEQTQLSLIFFDIDDFKKFNDTYGHLTGDQILCTLAAQAKDIIAQYEDAFSRILAARYGGEEFALILSGKAAGQSSKIAEQLRRLIQKTALRLRDTDSKVLKSGLYITVSLGVADIRPMWEGAFQTNLIDYADKALYHAKSKGKNCTVLYTPEKPEAYSLVSSASL